MNATSPAPAHTLLERHLTIGANHYALAASSAGADRLRLTVVGRSPDGEVVTELAGGIAATDLPAVADALRSTLDGLVAMRHGRAGERAGERAGRHPRRGTRWSAEDDERLVSLHREGAGEKTLMTEFGRSRGGIRARLETLGELEAGSAPYYRNRPGQS